MNSEEIRNYSLSMKGATEDIKWGNDLCFCVGEKMFTVIRLDGNPGMSFKVSKEMFEALIELPHFKPAPYLGRYKWVYLEDYNLISKVRLFEHIHASYELVKSKLSLTMRREIDVI